MPSLRSGKKTVARAVSERRVAPTASSRLCGKTTSPKTMNNRSSHSEIAEATDKQNNTGEVTSDETGTCSTGLNIVSKIAENVQADGEEASEITTQSAQSVEIGDKSNSADPGALDSSEANKHAAKTLLEASEGSESPTIPNTPPVEHTPIIVNEKVFVASCESISNASNESQILAHDFTRAFDNTTGVPILSQQERISSDDVTTENTPLNFESHTSERGKKRKGSNVAPGIGEVQAGTSRDSPIELTDDFENITDSVPAKRQRRSARKGKGDEAGKHHST